MPEGFPFMIVGNKSDLESERQVQTSQAEKLCKQNGDLLFLETSAKTNVNVEEAFKELALGAIKRQEELNKHLDETMQSKRAQEKDKHVRLGKKGGR